MADYSLTAAANLIHRNIDGADIPNDPNNVDWQAYQVWVDAGGFADPYIVPPITPQQQFNNLVAAGINTAWTLSGGPDGSLNGLYAIDPQSQFNITAETVTILLNGTFSTGGTTRFWLDAVGTPMPMDLDQFKAFAVAVSSYINSLYAVLGQLAAGQSADWPSNLVTINA